MNQQAKKTELPATAEQRLDEMLQQAELRKKPSYRPGQVQTILGCSDRTFWRLCAAYEPDPKTGHPINPGCLVTYLLIGERRVRYSELVLFLHRNNTYRRKNAIDPNQLDLFGG